MIRKPNKIAAGKAAEKLRVATSAALLRLATKVEPVPDVCPAPLTGLQGEALENWSTGVLIQMMRTTGLTALNPQATLADLPAHIAKIVAELDALKLEIEKLPKRRTI